MFGRFKNVKIHSRRKDRPDPGSPSSPYSTGEKVRRNQGFLIFFIGPFTSFIFPYTSWRPFWMRFSDRVRSCAAGGSGDAAVQNENPYDIVRVEESDRAT